MRRYTLTFFREAVPVAKLLLDLSWSGQTVKKWSWEGEAALCESLASTLPNNDQRLYTLWACRADHAAEREGLSVQEHYEGEPFHEYDHYYRPDDPTGPDFRRRAAK